MEPIYSDRRVIINKQRLDELNEIKSRIHNQIGEDFAQPTGTEECILIKTTREGRWVALYDHKNGVLEVLIHIVVGRSGAKFNPKLEAKGLEGLERVMGPWREKGFRRNVEEFLDTLGAEDKRVAYISRLNRQVSSLEEMLELLSWSIEQERINVLG